MAAGSFQSVSCRPNPEGRRQVVAQILDYAKELARWSSSDLQREVRRRLKLEGDPLLEVVRAVDADVDEVQFNDSLTANLRRGRFLLLIVGHARGTFGTRLRQAGLAASEIADVLGWSEDRVERLLATYVDQETIVMALARRIEQNEKRPKVSGKSPENSKPGRTRGPK